jgi:hypothetical protein
VLYSFLISYACFHKDLAHLVVKIIMLNSSSIYSIHTESLVGALCVAVDLF